MVEGYRERGKGSGKLLKDGAQEVHRDPIMGHIVRYWRGAQLLFELQKEVIRAW